MLNNLVKSVSCHWKRKEGVEHANGSTVLVYQSLDDIGCTDREQNRLADYGEEMDRFIEAWWSPVPLNQQKPVKEHN